MEISGNQKVKAPQDVVFQALLNPEVLKNSIPGCDSAEFVEFPTGRQLKLLVSPNIPGFKGPYTIYLQTGEVIAPSRVVIIAEPTSSVGSIRAVCTVNLSTEGDATLLNYHADANLDGKIAAIPEFVAKGAVKTGLDQFFKNFEKQVSTIRA